jgi:hypothetical protein
MMLKPTNTRHACGTGIQESDKRSRVLVKGMKKKYLYISLFINIETLIYLGWPITKTTGFIRNIACFEN